MNPLNNSLERELSNFYQQTGLTVSWQFCFFFPWAASSPPACKCSFSLSYYFPCPYFSYSIPTTTTAGPTETSNISWICKAAVSNTSPHFPPWAAWWLTLMSNFPLYFMDERRCEWCGRMNANLFSMYVLQGLYVALVIYICLKSPGSKNVVSPHNSWPPPF